MPWWPCQALGPGSSGRDPWPGYRIPADLVRAPGAGGRAAAGRPGAWPFFLLRNFLKQKNYCSSCSYFRINYCSSCSYSLVLQLLQAVNLVAVDLVLQLLQAVDLVAVDLVLQLLQAVDLVAVDLVLELLQAVDLVAVDLVPVFVFVSTWCRCL